MTRQETRQLGIEFERRLLIMYPEYAIAKLDTDTIYSFLNLYQEQYVKLLCLISSSGDNAEAITPKIQEIFKSIIKHKILPVELLPVNESYEESRPWKYNKGDVSYRLISLPKDFYSYIRSSSVVSRTYKSGNIDEEHLSIVPNKLIKQEDVEKILLKPYNKDAILRSPLIVFENYPYTDRNGNVVTRKNGVKLFIDRYTDVASVDMVYYSIPYKFNIINYDDSDETENAVHSTCMLPHSCFEDLVNGALQLFATYKSRQPQLRQLKELEDNK